MRSPRRLYALAAALAFFGVSDFLAGRAEAQSRAPTPNTYADFPFNQGSLFYRPQGSNAYTRPRTAPPRQAPAQAQAPRRRLFSRWTTPRQPVYQQPAAPTYYYAPQAAPAR